MDAVHEPAGQDSAEMRQGIDDTRSAMADKMEALENRVMGKVQSAQETVQDSIQSAKDAVASVKRTFDINHQVQERPWTIVGGCFLAGLAAGYLIPSGPPRSSKPPHAPAAAGTNGTTAAATPPVQAEPPSHAGVFEPFKEEIDMAKGMAIGFVMSLVRESIKESVPQLAPKIDALMNGLTTKLGGAPIEPRSP
jgi:ElaB/YqjD/DUF883 family membrane-anchored ribosome-binding protein